MTAHTVRRYLTAATIAISAIGTLAVAAPLKLSQVFTTDLQIVVPERGSSKLVIATNPSYFGISGGENKIGMDRDVKGELSIAATGLPEGLSVAIDSAKVTWKADEGYLLKLTLKGEHDSHLSVGDGDYHFSAVVTNSKTGFQTLMDLAIVHNEPTK